MTDVYFFNRAEGLAGFVDLDEDNARYSQAYEGPHERPWPDLETWVPLRGFEYCGEGEDGRPLRKSSPLADITCLGGWIAVSSRFVEELGEILRKFGRLYPIDLNHRGAIHRYYCYACTNVVDCLDPVNSKGMRDRDNPNRFRLLSKPAFFEDRIGANEIFVVPYLQKGHIFVTDAFLKRLQATRLTGVELYKDARNFAKDSRWQAPRPAP